MLGNQNLADLIGLVGAIALVSAAGAFMFSYGALGGNDWKANPLEWKKNPDGKRNMQGFWEFALIHLGMIPVLSAAVIGLIGYFLFGGNSYLFASVWPHLAIATAFFTASLLASCAAVVLRKLQRAREVANQQHQARQTITEQSAVSKAHTASA